MKTYYKPPLQNRRNFGTCTFKEVESTQTAEGAKITYQCSGCGHRITLPEQQGFNFCYLCGGEVRKIRSDTLTWNPLIFSKG